MPEGEISGSYRAGLASGSSSNSGSGVDSRVLDSEVARETDGEDERVLDGETTVTPGIDRDRGSGGRATARSVRSGRCRPVSA